MLVPHHVEKALKRLDGVESVQVNLVHGIIVVEGDPARVAQDQVAKKVEELGYTAVATEAQRLSTDEVIFSTVRWRGFLAIGVAVADLLFDPLDLFGLPGRIRVLVSGVLAAMVLLWIGYPILRKTLMAVGQRVVNANVLLSAGAWGVFGIGVALAILGLITAPVAIVIMTASIFAVLLSTLPLLRLRLEVPEAPLRGRFRAGRRRPSRGLDA